MDRWGGAAAIKLLAIGRNVANRVTTDRKGNTGSGPHPGFFAVTWHGNMWANVNRGGQPTNFTVTPAPTGRVSTMLMTAASPPIPHWAASSNSWIRAARCRR